MASTQLALDLPFRPALGAADFVVSDSNRDAVAWLDRWPDWPGRVLAIHGPAGCGKTHLAHVWQARSSAQILAVADASALPPRAAVILEETGDIELSPEKQVALFHFLNRLREQEGYLLLLSQVAPARWPATLPDLASRLAAIPAIAVAAPDDRLLSAILIKHFADRQLTVGDDVINFLTRHIERSFAAAAQSVAAIDRAALSSRRRVTLPLVREIIGQNSDEDRQA
ncbi:MAG: DNA replication protein [Rhodospirillaceae bacterium]|nr:MAG: DNA replication protein [Rhodospirillaceae bacterium]